MKIPKNNRIKDLRIIYMGTPEFAVAPLEKLLLAGCNVVAAVTAPDKPAGRGKKIQSSAVKDFARSNQLNILQPTYLKEPGFANQLKSLKPDLQVVVAFRMLPELVWSIPSKGTFNLHASLLPQYRGAAPINWAIINGERETGITTFKIDAQIDTGEILFQEKIWIGAGETAGQLHDRMMVLGADLVLKTVQQLAKGEVQSIPQKQPDDSIPLHKAPKIFRNDCQIDWNRRGPEVFNLIRGLSPYPGAFTHMVRKDGEKVVCKIFSATLKQADHHEIPGTIQTDGKTRLDVCVSDGWLHIDRIQQAGKRSMEVQEFLRGINWTFFQPRFS